MQTELSSSVMKWKGFSKLFCMPQVWVPITDKGPFTAIPNEYLSQEMKEFVIEKIEGHNALINDNPASVKELLKLIWRS